MFRYSITTKRLFNSFMLLLWKLHIMWIVLHFGSSQKTTICQNISLYYIQFCSGIYSKCRFKCVRLQRVIQFTNLSLMEPIWKKYKFVGCNFTPLNTVQSQITNDYILSWSFSPGEINYPLTRQVNGSLYNFHSITSYGSASS